ncbi:hypothetical protein IKG60_01120 [Candidatus Saccharibacteria bacterium]|nr:hypothetical protein [Candidatus Saccharibacteria bacterium]
MKKKQQKTKNQQKMRLFGAMAVLAFSAVLMFLFLGMSNTIEGMKQEVISHEPSAILASAGLSENKDVFLSAMYYDQRADECVNMYDMSQSRALAARQFEWESCGYYNRAMERGLVDYELGDDYLPVFSAGRLTSNRGLGDAKRWFSAVEGKSASYTGTLGMKYEAEGAKFYFQRDEFYPLDEAEFSKGDYVNKDGHNHLFTMNFAVPFTVLLSGSESMEITADDDTFVYIGGKLAIDMGGIHGATTGKFVIHNNGEVYAASGDEDLAYTGIRLSEGEGAMVHIFHADRDASESVFGVWFNGMNLTTTESKLAKQNNGVQIAYDPTDPTYEAPLGQSIAVQPDNTKGYIAIVTIEGIMIVAFAVLVAVAAKTLVRRKA